MDTYWKLAQMRGRYSAGIIPVMIHPRTFLPVFVLGLERCYMSGQLFYSDFGGKSNQGETPVMTANRECHEETNGLVPWFGNLATSNLLRLVFSVTPAYKRYYYFKQIPYDESLPERFMVSTNIEYARAVQHRLQATIAAVVAGDRSTPLVHTVQRAADGRYMRVQSLTLDAEAGVLTVNATTLVGNAPRTVVQPSALAAAVLDMYLAAVRVAEKLVAGTAAVYVASSGSLRILPEHYEKVKIKLLRLSDFNACPLQARTARALELFVAVTRSVSNVLLSARVAQQLA